MRASRWSVFALLVPLWFVDPPSINYYPSSTSSNPAQLGDGLFVRFFPATSSPLSGFFTSFWKLADTSDSIGGVTLTNNGPASFAAGKIGNAASMAGTQYFSNASVSVTGPAITASCWFKASTNASNQYVLSLGDNTNVGLQIYLSTTGAVGTYTDTGHILTSTATTYGDGAWHHVIAHNDGAGNLTLIVDNGSPKSVAGVTAVPTASRALNIGRYTGASGPLTGMVDAMGMAMNATPNASQISAMWNAGSGAEPPF